MKLEEIEKIANLVRKEFENHQINYNHLKTLYQTYNKLENIDEFIKHSKNLFPHLNCGLATLYLQDKLKQGKIALGKYNNNSHTFLTIENIIIDITSDQYGGPKVYVGPIKEPWRIEHNNP